MHDDRPTTDLAGARIREALPTPDAAAIDRIAERIAAGATPSRSTRPARRRRRPVLRPVLAAGAVASAAAIALLAPGSDDSSERSGLLALGPDAAAADVLRAAGEQAAKEPWRPLEPGEYHYVRSTFEYTADQVTRISERWTAADGTTTTRESVDGRTVADGESFWMPAERCSTMPSAGQPPSLPTVDDTLPAGSAPPDCWQGGGINDPLLRAATGRVVDAPPVGAAVHMPITVGGPLEEPGTIPRFGEYLREGEAPDPMLAAPAPADGSSAITGRVMFPRTVPVATTWIEVEPRVVEAFEATSVPGPVSADVPVVLASWTSAFTMEQLAALPTDADAMVDELRAAAARASVNQPGNPDFGEADIRAIELEATISIATELLASAPISPDVRRATFEAIAELRSERQPVRVLRDERLADGSPAIGLRFEIDLPPGYEHPDNADDHIVLLLDAETAQPVSQSMRTGLETAVVTWDAPRRVDAIE